MPAPSSRTSPPTRSARPSVSDRSEYIKRTQEQVKRRQAEQKSRTRYIITDLDRAEPKAGEVSVWSVIPYEVKERHHPEEIPTGKLAWKRPFTIHRNIGLEEIIAICPKSFNARDRCVVHEDVAMLRKDWDANEEQIRRVQGSDRELYLFYDHSTKKVVYYDAAYGSVKNPGFGYMLGSRLDNPVKEDWLGFWLPDEEGYALRITWGESSFGGGGSWIRPISIDFVPRKEQPVPSWVWGKAVELSTILVKTTSKDLEEMYYEGGSSGVSTDNEEPEEEAAEEPEEESAEEPEDEPVEDEEPPADEE